MTIAKETTELLAKLGVAKGALVGGDLIVRSPVTGEQIAALKTISPADATKTIEAAHKAFQTWRMVPVDFSYRQLTWGERCDSGPLSFNWKP